MPIWPTGVSCQVAAAEYVARSRCILCRASEIIPEVGWRTFFFQTVMFGRDKLKPEKGGPLLEGARGWRCGPGSLGGTTRTIGKHSVRNTTVLAAAFLAGCQATMMQNSGVARVLTELEMDKITAGSAAAAKEATAHALGLDAESNVLGNAAAYSGGGPIVGAPSLYYANSQAIASSSSDLFAKTALSSHVSVYGVNGGASIDATAGGLGTKRAQVEAQFYGISTSREDIVFGSIAAAACCGLDAEAEVGANTQTNGAYSRELRAAPASDTPGQAHNQIDVAVASSALPILDPAQMVAAGAPTRASPKY